VLRVTWSPQAQADLDAIHDFVARGSERYARLLVQRIVAAAEQIPEFPKLGRVVPEYRREDLRERILHSYRIVYRIGPSGIEIVTVLHGARRMPEIEG
jgi:plasmid stabilization system protein ParE